MSIAHTLAPSGGAVEVVIPARMASTRLPRKMLLAETGKPLIQHTYEAAATARSARSVRVATDHEAIAEAVHRFGGCVEMTDPGVASGTDRVAEVARRIEDARIVVNVQGDEPEVAGASIDLAVRLLETHADAAMATVATPIRRRALLEDPACVKVVFDAQGRALYFSRSPIPHPRQWHDSLFEVEPPLFYQHIGLYAYRRDFLLGLARLPQCATERTESLEQLRVLHSGYPILVGIVAEAFGGIDTADDYAAFVARHRRLRRAG